MSSGFGLLTEVSRELLDVTDPGILDLLARDLVDGAMRNPGCLRDRGPAAFGAVQLVQNVLMQRLGHRA